MLAPSPNGRFLCAQRSLRINSSTSSGEMVLLGKENQFINNRKATPTTGHVNVSFAHAMKNKSGETLVIVWKSQV